MLTGMLLLLEVETKDPLAKMLKRSLGSIKPLGEQRHSPRPEITAVVEKMMKIDLKARDQAVEEVGRDLEAAQEAIQRPPEPEKKKTKAPFVDPELGSHADIFLRPGFQVPAA